MGHKSQQVRKDEGVAFNESPSKAWFTESDEQIITKTVVSRKIHILEIILDQSQTETIRYGD